MMRIRDIFKISRLSRSGDVQGLMAFIKDPDHRHDEKSRVYALRALENLKNPEVHSQLLEVTEAGLIGRLPRRLANRAFSLLYHHCSDCKERAYRLAKEHIEHLDPSSPAGHEENEVPLKKGKPKRQRSLTDVAIELLYDYLTEKDGTEEYDAGDVVSA